MKIKFQADADLNDDIVKGIKRRVPEIDFQSAIDAGFEGLDDMVVLAISAGEARILVTHDRRTMPIHFAKFIEKQECAGVLVVSKRKPVGRVIEEIVLIWGATEPEEYRNRILTLQ
jgi:hypothetical protein